MIERWHRSLKAAIMCYSDREWSGSLSSVLIGLRTNVLDVGASPAEFVFGTTLRIPGEFVLPEDFAPNPHIFLEEFREHMRKVKPVPVTQKYTRKAFVFKELSSCSHVFLRDHARKALLNRFLKHIHVIELHLNNRCKCEKKTFSSRLNFRG